MTRLFRWFGPHPHMYSPQISRHDPIQFTTKHPFQTSSLDHPPPNAILSTSWPQTCFNIIITTHIRTAGRDRDLMATSIH